MAVIVENPRGTSDILLVCEHASCEIPAKWQELGLDEAARRSHIAFDPGALGLARRLSERLDARLVRGTVSRLIYDCNRPPSAKSAMPETSEHYQISGNVGLSLAQKQERIDEVYEPFRATLAGEVARTRNPVLVTIHSFTKVYFGVPREVEIGVLADSDRRLAAPLFQALRGQGFKVRENEPYGPADGVTHTLQEHAIAHGHLNVMLEIRNDLLETAQDERAMGDFLAPHLANVTADILQEGLRP